MEAGDDHREQDDHAYGHAYSHKSFVLVPRHTLKLHSRETDGETRDFSRRVSNGKQAALFSFDLPQVLAYRLPFACVAAQILVDIHTQDAVFVDARDALAGGIRDSQLGGIGATRGLVVASDVFKLIDGERLKRH